MMTGWLALMLFAAAAQDTQQMRVRPTSEADAVREFEATCLAGFRDAAKLDQAVAASKRGYTAEAVAGQAGWRNWTSPFGSLHYFVGSAAGGRGASACDFTAFTQAPVNRRVLAEAVEAMAARHAARELTEFSEGNSVAWSWIDAQNRPVTVVMVLDRKTPQQIVLSLRPRPLGSS